MAHGLALQGVTRYSIQIPIALINLFLKEPTVFTDSILFNPYIRSIISACGMKFYIKFLLL
jgi:hypothetical protein